jgi:hypothetical protein
MDGLYMGINIPEVERQKAPKALNCDRQCPLWVISDKPSQAKIALSACLKADPCARLRGLQAQCINRKVSRAAPRSSLAS